MARAFDRTILGLAAAALLTAPGAAAQTDTERQRVQLKEAPLREAPSPFGPVLESLAFGTPVTVTGTREGWARAAGTADHPPGWIHASALTTRDLALKPGEGDVQAAASGEELALAGKGFSRAVEERYRKRSGTDYRPVDRLERIRIPEAEARRFLEEGNLRVR